MVRPKRSKSAPPRGYRRRIKTQFEILMEEWKLDVTTSIPSLLIPQSVTGRVWSGHGLFRGKAMREIPMEVVFDCCGVGKTVRGKRQELIDESLAALRTICDKGGYLNDSQGKPLFGVNFLRDSYIKPSRENIAGAVLAGRMDSSYWREQTTQRYPCCLEGKDFSIGYGEEYLLNTGLMRQLGIKSLDGVSLGKEELELYLQRKILGELGEEGSFDDTVFIRGKNGLGICDDTAFLNLYRFYGLDAMRMGIVMDNIDTYCKYADPSKSLSIDERFAEELNQRWKNNHGENVVTPEETMRFIYLSAKRNGTLIPFSDSVRRYVQVQNGNKSSVIQAHLNYLEGRPFEKCKLGFGNPLTNTEFYRIFEERQRQYESRSLEVA